ncbi:MULTISPECIES: hypothetical protein [unclassified Archaeoglobus]|jgi:hypothetical protein|uniref:hypothetical protein n=1 Tax=unclassified Archaeoglobus TaxID=2643606 RepID=UPI0025BA9450|nr:MULTISPECIES: hypothetical protein [unclassified Archaeoglobus]
MVKRFYIDENIKNAPVRVSVVIPRRLFEEASEAAKYVGKGNIENLITFLLENFVEELKEMGYELIPFWERVKRR